MNSPTSNNELADRLAFATAGLASRPAETAEVCAQIAALAMESGDSLVAAQAHRAAARALAYAGRWQESVQTAESARMAATAASLHEEAARARLAAMHALVESGRLDEAMHQGVEALRTLEGLGATALAGRARINIGIVAQRQGDLPAALQWFDEAETQLQAEPLILAQLENNRAEALLRLFRFGDARRSFEACLRRNRDAGAVVPAAIALGNLADLDARSGDPARAISRFDEALQFLGAASSPVHALRMRAERAESLVVAGLGEEAATSLHALVEDLDAAHLPREAARARASLGVALAACGRLAAARSHLLAARSQYSELADQLESARTDLDLADLAHSEGNAREAARLAGQALARQGLRRLDHARALLHLSDGALASGDTQRSLLQLEQAEHESLGNPPLEASVALRLSQTLHLMGDTAQAVSTAARAATTLERIQSSFPSRRMRLSFTAPHDARRMQLAMMLESAAPDAFEVASIVESLAVHVPPGAPSSPPPDDHDLGRRSLREELLVAASAVADLGANAPIPPAMLKRVRDLEAALDDLDGRLRQSSGRPIWDRRTPSPADAVALSRGGTIIRLALNEDSLLGLGLSDGSGFVIPHICAREEIELAVHALHEHMRHASRVTPLDAPIDPTSAALLRRIRDLLQPILERAPSSTARPVTIVADGLLASIPYLALGQPGEALPAWEFCPSLSLLQSAGEVVGDIPSDPRVVLVGGADGTLPAVRDEIQRIQEVWGQERSSVLVGSAATVEATMGAARNADILHIAAHGFTSRDDPGVGGVRLSDRWLMPQDLCGGSMTARLVLLSACDSGPTPSIREFHGRAGLWSGFLHGGSLAVVASLWPVQDGFCASLVESLHRLWHDERGLSVRTSLLPVLEVTRERSPHPVHWAAFTMMRSFIS